MGLHYTHLLVATSPFFRPEARRVAAFFGAVGGFVGGPCWRFGVDESSWADGTPDDLPASDVVLEGRVMLAGDSVRDAPLVRGSSGEAFRPLPSPFLRAVSMSPVIEAALRDPDSVPAHMRDKLALLQSAFGMAPPPAPIADSEPDDGGGGVAVVCASHATLRAMSATYDRPRAIAFGEPCSPAERVGHFYNPGTDKVLRRAGAGSARFWIELRAFDKYQAPRFVDDLDLAHPDVVRAAEESFEVRFVQGCRWS